MFDMYIRHPDTKRGMLGGQSQTQQPQMLTVQTMNLDSTKYES